jgi:hypothetical protein
MTRDEILQMVRWSGHPLDEAQIDIVLRFQAVLADFAKSAYAAGAAAERNACAAIARQWDVDHQGSNYGGCIANLIEARGQA